MTEQSSELDDRLLEDCVEVGSFTSSGKSQRLMPSSVPEAD